MSSYSAMLLLSCARRVTKKKRGDVLNRSAESYEDVVFAAFGPHAKVALTVMILVLTFLALIAYFILLADLLVPVMVLALKGSVDWVCTASNKEQRAAIIILCACVITPPSLLKDIGALRYTSLMSMLSISLLGIGVLIEAARSNLGGDEPRWYPKDEFMLHDDLNLFAKDISGVLESVSIMACAFMCHFNVLPLHKGLQEPTRNRLKVMIYVTIASVWTFYAVISVFGYAEFRASICDNLLKNYDHTKFSFVLVGQVGLSCTLLLSMPLLSHPARGSLETLWAKGQPQPFWIRSIETLAIVVLAAFIGSQIASIVTVWSFLGSTVSIMIGYILPAASYLRLRDPQSVSATYVSAHAPARLVETDSLTLVLNPGEHNPNGKTHRGIFEDLNRHRMPAFVLLVVGIVLMVACTIQAIISSTNTTTHSYCVESVTTC
eukprot:TRINITY_DN303_c0_g1_i4.p1 TRINITY_DN303_c0_g1~~TRINITY_DN303_c0_g1_i4.p1  ORF type:complete len:435 (+),score=88.98 TRINITY_DN303_c0_g1_i4:590-1894(+)